MKTNPFNFEILVTGFSHLLWLTLFTLLLLGISPSKIIDSLSKIGSGTAVVLIALIGGVSFYLGFLAQDFLIFLSYLFNKRGRKNRIYSYRSEKDKIWNNKSFFRSMAFAIVGILIFLLSMGFFNSESYKYFLAIIVIGFIVESTTIIAWLYWKHIERKIANRNVVCVHRFPASHKRKVWHL